MTPGQLRHAAARLKALSHEAALGLRIPPPTTASPRDHFDAAQRVAATVMDRHMPIFSLSSSLRLSVAIQASRKMTSRSHHPGSALEMAGGATMTLTVKLAVQAERGE